MRIRLWHHGRLTTIPVREMVPLRRILSEQKQLFSAAWWGLKHCLWCRVTCTGTFRKTPVTLLPATNCDQRNHSYRRPLCDQTNTRWFLGEHTSWKEVRRPSAIGSTTLPWKTWLQGLRPLWTTFWTLYYHCWLGWPFPKSQKKRKGTIIHIFPFTITLVHW